MDLRVKKLRGLYLSNIDIKMNYVNKQNYLLHYNIITPNKTIILLFPIFESVLLDVIFYIVPSILLC